MKTMTLKTLAMAMVSAGMAAQAFAGETNIPPQADLQPQAKNALTAQQFVTDAAVGGMKEIRLSEVALDKTQDPEVKKFAALMVKDHAKANAKLEKIAQSGGLVCPPMNTFAADDPNWNNPIINGSDQAKGAYLLTTNMPVGAYQDFRRVKSQSGREFDVAYVKEMVSDHAKAIDEFEIAGRDLSDPALRQFATETVPILRDHSQMAQRLANALSGTPTAAVDTENQTVTVQH
jgi:putative membrane protein